MANYTTGAIVHVHLSAEEIEHINRSGVNATEDAPLPAMIVAVTPGKDDVPTRYNVRVFSDSAQDFYFQHLTVDDIAESATA
jgi:hypothetical protein